MTGTERNGRAGRVIGVDRDKQMLAEARRRFDGRPTVSLEAADLHALPLATNSVDRAGPTGFCSMWTVRNGR